MNRRRGLWALPLLGVIVLLSAVLGSSKTALAHPLDVYLQATYITVAPSEIVVELDLTPGVLVAPQALVELDPDGDQEITDAEGRAYVDTILSQVVLQVDGEPMTLSITKIEMPTYLNIQAGYGTIRVFTTATLSDGTTGAHQISYANDYAPTGSAYQVNTFVENGATITLGSQNRDEIQQRLTVDFAIGDSGLAADESSAVATETRAEASGQARRLLAYFDPPELPLGTLAIALALAVMLGGLHALTPGHGKTLVAAYLVGSRGTVRHAAALGAIVTFTHTASVIVVGLVALFASQFIVPNVLVPILQVVSGVLVVAMGARLVWQRWVAFRRGRSGDDAHSHNHDHPHAHAYTHDHGDGRVHSHLPPTQRVSAGSLVAMGVSGGLVPCPEALGIMIIAVGLNRIVLGLGLIVSFSFGLAAVLIGIGILLVRSRAMVERLDRLGGRLSGGLPLGSAVIVTVLGVGIVIRGLASYLG